MNSTKLKKAPLQEVIFELKWKLPVDTNGIPYDPGFENAFGLFAKHLENENFPIQKSLLPPNSNSTKVNVLTHQFWQKELEWPVIQIGRGILTVNDVEGNYVWGESYRPTIEKALMALKAGYREQLTFLSLSLKYIDAVDVADDVTSSPEYIAKNFRTEIVNNYELPGVAAGVNMTQVFVLEDQSLLGIQIQTALNNINQKRAIVWITEVRKESRATGDDLEEDLIQWLDRAHAHCSQVFKDMLDKDFYASFNE